jgi:hypothetical protein
MLFQSFQSQRCVHAVQQDRGHLNRPADLPFCPGWVEGPGPPCHNCWKLQGNLSEFGHFLFPVGE